METLRFIKVVQREIERRELERETKKIRGLSDVQLRELEDILIKERDEEYKRLGWIPK